MLKKIAAFSLLLSAFSALAYSALPQIPDSSHVGISGATYSLTAIAGTGGSVSPARATAKAGVQKPAKIFVFSPALKKGVQTITGSYLTNTTYKYLNALTGREISSLPAPVGVRVKVVISSVASNANLVGTFAPQAANAGPNQIVLTGTAVTLDGRLSTGAGIFSWTQVSGPTTVSLNSAGSSMATFTAPALTGTYVFKLVHGTTATTTVFVSDNVGQIAKSQCVMCHAGQRVGAGIYANWSGSAHKQKNVLCYVCHVDANTDGHPGPSLATDKTTYLMKNPDGSLSSTYVCLNGTCHAGGSIVWTRDLSKSSHLRVHNDNACSSCHGTDLHNPAKNFQEGCAQCHSGQITQTAAGTAFSTFTGSVHGKNTEFKEGGSWDCRGCHTGTTTNMVSPGYTFNYATKTWTGTPLALYSTPRQSEHRAETWAYATGANCTSACHASPNTEFYGSKHWKGTSEDDIRNATTFTNDYRGPVPYTGSAAALFVNRTTYANFSWLTKDKDVYMTCAYRCHFAPNLGPDKTMKDVSRYYVNNVVDRASNGVNSAGVQTGGNAELRPGLDTCVACHYPHKPEAATARTTCYTCHVGANGHGVPTINFEKSSHNTGDAAKNYYQLDQKACIACHSPHGLEAVFYRLSSSTTIMDGKFYNSHSANHRTNGCQECHVGAYGIAGNSPHYGGYKTYNAGLNGALDNPGAGWPAAKTQYVTQGAVCSDCHSHNNTINHGYAEGGHGAVSDDPMNPWTHYDWSIRTNDGSRGNSNCDRCHTTYGFLKMLNMTTNVTRLRPVAGQPNNVMICIACHMTPTGGVAGVLLPEGQLRTSATPRGSAAGALTNGYFALFSSSAAAITSGNTKIQVKFPGFKNSSICIPCHSGRTTDKVFIETYAKSAAVNKNYSTLQNSIYQHAKNSAQTFIGMGAYDFSGQLQNYTSAANQSMHTTINPLSKNDTAFGYSATVPNPNNPGQGPCVGCHYNKTGVTHSLEVVVSAANCSAATCHPAGFSSDSLKVSEENYKSAVKALDALIRSKFAPLLASGSSNLADERAGYWRYGRFMKAPGAPADLTTATKAYGAWYNWQILALYDSAAYVHNTNYARKILVDTVDYLDDGLINGSAPNTIANINTTVPGALTAAEVAAASDFTNSIATTKIMNRHVDASSAAYKVQYTLTGSTGSSPVTCATCHNPSNETTLQAEARKSWAGSGHGETTALPWIPASSHLWRNAGYSASYTAAASGSDCVRCHTAEGAAQFFTSSFTNVNTIASAADAAINSPLNCNTCHVNPINATSNRLAVPQVTIYYNISTAGVQKTHLSATFPNVGESNICIPCHAGRVSGAALADADAKGFNFTNNSFQNSHYMAVAGLMYAKVGFINFTAATTIVPGTSVTYGASLTANEDGGLLTSTHRKLGTTDIRGDSHNVPYFVAGNLDTNGPCVTCHLKGYTNASTNRPGAGHTLKIDQSAWDNVCTNCHAAEAGWSDEGQPLLVEEQAIPFNDAQSILKGLVQSRLGCEYDPAVYPYFFKAGLPHISDNALKDWGTAKHEGAAFNLNLLTREPYAYLHARTYVRRLIYDSIDFLDDGILNLSVSSYLQTLGYIMPASANNTSDPNIELWKYLKKYDRTTGAWDAISERP